MTPEKLREVMDSNHLNVKKTADLLGVSKGAVYHWRNGTRPISKLTWDCLILELQKQSCITIIGGYWDI